MIKTFEAYSFPDSVVDLSTWISTFVNKKIRWWIGRNKLANYKEDFVFDREEMGIQLNSDFPFERIKLELKFTNNESDKWNMMGYASHFKRKNWIDVDLEYSQFNRGKIIPSLKFDISSDKHVIEVQELEEAMTALTRHEILHLYQYYKKHKNKAKYYTHNAAAYSALFCLKNTDSQKLYDFMYLLYILLTKEETEANLAEFTAGIKTKKIEKLSKRKGEIESIPKDVYLKNIKDELSDEEIERIPKEFLDNYLQVSKEYSLKPKKSIIRLADSDFDNFMSRTYDIVKSRLPYWKKKIDKINYRLSN